MLDRQVSSIEYVRADEQNLPFFPFCFMTDKGSALFVIFVEFYSKSFQHTSLNSILEGAILFFL
jgi:hypothetical protein